MIRFIVKNNQGSIVMMTILMMTAILTATLLSSALIIRGIQLNRSQKWSTTAYFAAESGIERVVWYLRKQGCDFDDSIWSGKCVSFGGACPAPIVCGAGADIPVGAAKYRIEYFKDGVDLKLKSTGSYSGLKRSVEIRLTGYFE